MRLQQPIFRTAASELWLGLGGELYRSSTDLGGERFAFSEGTDDGRLRTTLVDFSQQWLTRSLAQVFAVSSTFRLGVDAFDATDVGGGDEVPDATFGYWIGQAQWVRRLPRNSFASQLLVRLDAQLSASPLFPADQFSLGGLRTVRGFRRNRLVRDNAVAGSVELRIPLLRSPLGAELVELAPFVDVGHGWDHRHTFGPKTLSGAGLTLYLRPRDRLNLAIHWALPLRDLEREGDDLQDHGLYVQATWRTR
jgi:hemolysin activation/secretion protein